MSGGVVGVRRKHISHHCALRVVGAQNSNSIQSIGNRLGQESGGLASNPELSLASGMLLDKVFPIFGSVSVSEKWDIHSS